MIYLILFLLEIIVIFFLSKSVHLNLSRMLMRITHNKNLSVYMMSFLFLPGTLVHEMAHFLVALFLLVPVGNLQLIPQIEDDGVRMGSVSIAKTDPIRRFFIGVAPLIFGVGIITLFFYFYPIGNLFDIWYKPLIAVYVVFTITNTMFSSKKDMEGLWGFLFIMASILIIFWLLGITLDFSGFIAKTTEIFKTSSLFLTIPIVLDVVSVAVLSKRAR